MAETRSVIIEPPRRWEAINLREVWDYRELLYFLIWRDVKVRYKQTAIGVAWAVLQPLLTMALFTLVFGTLIQVPSDDLPYPVFTYTALVPWTFFAASLTRASGSLVNDSALITKVYFPRVLLPLSAVLSMILDFAAAFVLLLAMLAWYGILPGIAVLTLPLFLLLALLTAVSCGLWLSALNVRYRDIAQVIPFLLQVWLFITPVAYASAIVPERWRAVYGLNPMVGVVEGFRWALLDTGPAPEATVGASAAVVIALFLGGIFWFRRTEHGFADVI
jgi:homopolymeric O-antigen transport system permease protein